MPVAVEDLYSQEPQAAGGTLQKAKATSAVAGQAEAVPKVESQDAIASRAGTKDAQAMYGSTSQASATGYNAMTGEIDPSQTASARLEEITSQDSPLMRRAAQMGMLEAGRRGLDNSSFAAGAATGAMVDRATPLAQQESAQAFQQSMANQQAVNRAREVSTGRETDISQFNAQQLNQMSQLNAKLGTEVGLANARAYNEASRLNAQLETAVAQGNQQEANRINMRMSEIQAEINLNNAQQRTQVSLANAAAANQASLQNAQLGTQVSLAEADAQNQMRRDVLAQNAALNEQYLRGEQAIDLASIQGRYQMLISSNETAARLYDSYFSSISNAMANDKIGPDRIAQYVNVQQSMLEAGLRMMDSMNGLDLGDFELPGATGTAGDIKKSGTITGGTIAPGDGEGVAETPLQPGDTGYWTEDRLRNQIINPMLGAF